MIQRMQDEDALPTQLYLSTNAADYDSFIKINRPRYKDSWERWNQTLDMLKHLDTRTVLRITLIRDYNTHEDMIPAFANMIKESSPNFIEVKSYMHIGRSTNRLDRYHMLDMEEVRHIANSMSQKSKIFSAIDESYVSRIVLLQNQEKFVDCWIPAYQ